MNRSASRLWIACLWLACLAPAAHAAVPIELWHSLGGGAALELDRVAQAFNASQNDYVVMPVYRGTERETVEAALMAQRKGQGPHLLQVDDSLSPAMSASPKSFIPVYQVMERARQPLSASGFLPVARDASLDERGRLVSLPFTEATPLLFFNKDALKTAGIDAEAPLKTWLDLQAVALKLVDNGAACAFTTDFPAWVHVENLLSRHNEPYSSGQGRQLRAVFNTRLLVLHVGMLSSWVQSGLFTYFGRRDEAEQKFASGDCALMTGASNALADIRRKAAFNLGVAPLPMHADFPGKPNVLPHGGSLWALSGKKPAEYTGVAKFIAFLSRPEIQAEWSQATGYLPATEAAFELSLGQGYYDREPLARISMQELRNSTVGAGNRLLPAALVRSMVNEELEAVWTRRKTPMEGIGDALARANKVLSLPAAPFKLP